jgi:hypothetical protein
MIIQAGTAMATMATMAMKGRCQVHRLAKSSDCYPNDTRHGFLPAVPVVRAMSGLSTPDHASVPQITP